MTQILHTSREPRSLGGYKELKKLPLFAQVVATHPFMRGGFSLGFRGWSDPGTRNPPLFIPGDNKDDIK